MEETPPPAERIHTLEEIFGGRDGPFERILFALTTAEKDGAAIEQLGPDAAILRSGRRALVLLRFDGDPGKLQKRLAAIIPISRRFPLELAIFGGPPELRRAAKKALPFFQQNRIQLYHLAEDGEAWHARASAPPSSSPLWRLLRVAPSLPPADWKRAAEKLAAQLAESAAANKELAVFRTVLSQRTPVATRVLLGVIVALFLLEMLFGGSESPPVLVRMGALVSSRVAEGEWWRLIACTFLHSGFMHIFMNGTTLLALGSFAERILGSRRFLVLYGLSALGGSIASALFSRAGFSVGASGAIWGVLGAQGMLAYRSAGLLPESVLAAAKKNAIVNLVINVGISMLPHVDISAHFGGGAIGALLVLSGVLTRGLPPLAEAEAGAVDRPPAMLTPASVAIALMLAGGLSVSLIEGKPFQLMEEPRFVRVSPPRAGVSFEVPALIAERPSEQEGAIVYGDLLGDPLLIALMPLPFQGEIAEAQMEAELEKLRGELAKPPESAKVLAPPEVKTIGGKRAVVVRSEFPSKLVLDAAVVVFRDAAWKLEVYTWPGSKLRGGLEHAIETMERL